MTGFITEFLGFKGGCASMSPNTILTEMMADEFNSLRQEIIRSENLQTESSPNF